MKKSSKTMSEIRDVEFIREMPEDSYNESFADMIDRTCNNRAEVLLW